MDSHRNEITLPKFQNLRKGVLGIENISFIIPVSNEEILHQNFLASELFQSQGWHQMIFQKNFDSAGKAYNDGMKRSYYEMVICCHQDVLLPANWLVDLKRSLDYLAHHDPNWGVLGCYGVTQKGHHVGHLYSHGWGVLGKPFDTPIEVQTLDEVVLIVRKSAGLRFDEGLPHFHLYGTDICLQAQQIGLKCYAISAFCIHNTNQIVELPDQFFDCYFYLKKKWYRQLPIYASCITISKSNHDLYRRKIKLWFHKTFRHQPQPIARLKDPSQIPAIQI